MSQCIPVSRSLADQCWALAGIAQAATCVDLVARGRTADGAATLALYRALLDQEPDSVQALASIGDFSVGLDAATNMLHKPNQEQIQVLRYTLAILDVTARLRKQTRLVQHLSESVGKLDNDNVIDSFDIPWSELGEIYVDTLGQLNQRVQVRGQPNLLQRPEVASKIRGLLLTGVRFAWLWHQLGGRRWHLLVNRRRMWQTTQLLGQLGHRGE